MSRKKSNFASNRIKLIDIFMDEKERIEQLRRELHEHNYRYYVENQPTISDYDFDQLMHELQQLEQRHPEMDDPNSPTQRVGSDLQTEFRQVEHRYPMLSLANTYSEQDVRDWYDSVSRGRGVLRDEVRRTLYLADLRRRTADAGGDTRRRRPWRRRDTECAHY